MRRHRSIHEVDISNLEAALRAEEPGGQAYETPREEIARLRKMELEPQHYDVDINKEVSRVQGWGWGRSSERDGGSDLGPSTALYPGQSPHPRTVH